MVILENDDVKVIISSMGAEMVEIFGKKTKKQYLWHGDPASWSRKAPILFPIVGKLNNGNYTWKSQTYHLSQHGFLRDLDFVITELSANSVTLKTESSPQTKIHFPFDWIFICRYILSGNKIKTIVQIINPSDDSNLLFSVGFHPAFNCPIDKNLSFSDYCIFFNKDETAEKWMLEDGLISNKVSSGITDYKIMLQKDTFQYDALVFKNLKSDEISLKSACSDHGVTVYCKDFPFMGIWSKAEAPFVCIEPWMGIADHTTKKENFSDKEGIITAEPESDFTCSFEIKVY